MAVFKLFLTNDEITSSVIWMENSTPDNKQWVEEKLKYI